MAGVPRTAASIQQEEVVVVVVVRLPKGPLNSRWVARSSKTLSNYSRAWCIRFVETFRCEIVSLVACGGAKKQISANLC